MTCLNELYGLLKNCSKCETEKLKNNFRKNITTEFGFNSRCNLCRKQHYDGNRDVIVNEQSKFEKTTEQKQM